MARLHSDGVNVHVCYGLWARRLAKATRLSRRLGGELRVTLMGMPSPLEEVFVLIGRGKTGTGWFTRKPQVSCGRRRAS
jgi:hypothetical protein